MGSAVLAALLVGCASKPAEVLRAGPQPTVQFEVKAPDGLDDLLRRHLDLGRVNRVAGGEALPEGELERIVAAAPEQARELLRTEGYFEAVVEARIVEPGPVPRVEVQVVPGPRAVVRSADMRLAGPAAGHADEGQAQGQAARAALGPDWPLTVGQPFRNEVWSGAKRSTLAQVRAQGYVTAEWAATDARVDVAERRVDLSGEVQSGPLHRTGELRIDGLHFHDRETVINLANFGPGTPATEDLLLDYQERLRRSGLFDRSTVTLAPNPADPTDTPVRVRLSERKLQEATTGVGISANVGPRLTFEHVHRRFLGRAYTARNRFALARDEQLWEGEISTHPLPGLYRNLVGFGLSRQRSDTDTVTAGRVRLGRAQETERISRLVFLEAERALTETVRGTDQRATALSGHYHGIWRDVDDVLLPTRGRALTAQVGAGQAWSDPGAAGPFGRAYARVNLYRPVGNWYTQARLELGQVFSRDNVHPPDSMLFRAGGDESVRGYSYRSLTPQVDGIDVGGKVLFTASAEVARPILKRLPELWGAVFVDVGRAAMRWRELDPAWGAGVGVRYRSPVGPVKLDLAWGEEVRRLRLHLSVGVSF